MRRFTVILAVIVSLFFAGLLVWVYWLKYGLFAIAVWVAMVLALPFSSLMHELGHMLFGAMVKIKAVPQFKLFGSSSCRLIPKTDKNLRWKLMFTTRGGLIVNAILFIIGIVALTIDIIPVWLALFMPANAYLYILNDMPVQFSNGKTDGLVYFELLSRADSAQVLLAVLTVQAQVLNGKPIEEVDEKLLFDLPQIQEDDPAFISLTELRANYFAAKGDTEQAQKYQSRLEQLKEDYLN